MHIQNTKARISFVHSVFLSYQSSTKSKLLMMNLYSDLLPAEVWRMSYDFIERFMSVVCDAFCAPHCYGPCRCTLLIRDLRVSQHFLQV